MEVKHFDDLNLYLKGFEIESIGNKAIKELQIDNKKKGIPLVYSIDSKIYYELADGTITTHSPLNDMIDAKKEKDDAKKNPDSHQD